MTLETGGGNRVSGGPRAEARPLRWEEMTEDQQRATREILDLVDAMARESRGARPSTGEGPRLELVLPRLDEGRSSRVVLIEGDRGVGKTALLVSVLAHWSDAVRSRPRPEVPDSPEVMDVLRRVYQDAEVVPLEILDLQPLPRSTHLLAHIAARLRPIVRLIDQAQSASMGPDRSSSAERTCAPWQGGGERCLAEDAWSDFTRTVAVGWDDALKARSRTLDLESYVDEQRQTESDRMDVRGSFARLMDRLVDDFAKAERWGARRPFFVLPIDDADMNAGRLVELVETLRMLWHPRLAFLITGDDALFELVLRRHVFREIETTGTTGARVDEGSGERAWAREARKASELSRQIFRKVVPLTQRFALRKIATARRWSTKFDRLSAVGGTSVGARISLNTIVNALDAEVPTDEMTMAGYLALLPALGDAAPGDVRDLQDFVMAAQRAWTPSGATRRARPKPVSRPGVPQRSSGRWWSVLFDLLESARRDLDEGNQTARALRELTVIDGTGTRRFDGSEVRLDARWRDVASFKVESRRVVFQAIAWWRVTFSQEAGADGPVMELHGRVSDAATAVIGAIMHEEALRAEETQTDHRFGQRGVLDGFALVENTFHGSSRGGLSSISGDVLSVTWPVPDWVSPIDALQVEQWWRGSVTEEATSLADIDRHARLLVHSVLRVAGVSVDSDRSLAWKALAVRVAELARGKASSPRARSFQTWARQRVALLAAPEYGLSVQAADEWLRELGRAFDGSTWQSLRDSELELSRIEMIQRGIALRMAKPRARAADLTQANVYKTVIDAEAPAHPWRRLVVSVVSLDEFERFYEQLDRVLGNGFVTEFIKRRFALTPPDVFAELKAVLDRNGSMIRRPARAIGELWHAAIDSTKKASLSKAVRVVGGAAPVVETEGLSFTRGPSEGPVRVELLPFDRSVEINEISEIRVRVVDTELMPPLDALYALATDVGRSQRNDSPTRQVEWLGVRCLVGENVFLWPALYWYQFGGLTTIEHAWNEAVGQLVPRELRSQPDPHWRVNALAYDLLAETNWLLTSFREQPGETREEPDLESWRGLISSLFTTTPASRERRAAWLGDSESFQSKLCLFATPELGLSAEVAGVILDVVMKSSENTKEVLQKQREQWASFCGLDLRSRRSVFAALYESLPGHPWNDRIGTPRGAKKAPTKKAPTEKAPTKKAPTKKAPTKKAPTKKAQAKRASSGRAA